jgi:hypothetical protein
MSCKGVASFAPPSLERWHCGVLVMLLASAGCSSTSDEPSGAGNSGGASSSANVGGNNAGGGGDAPVSPLEHEWSFSFGAAGDQVARSLVIDPSGDILVAGHYNGTMQLGSETLATIDNAINGFIARLSPEGEVLWARSYAAEGIYTHVSVGDLALDDAGAVYACGTFSGTVDFGGPSEPLVGTAENDSFALSLTAEGDTRWGTAFTTVSPLSFHNACRGIAVTSGRAFMAGSYANEIDFGGGTVNANGYGDLYIVALDSATGDYEDALSLGGSDEVQPSDVVADAANIYVVGEFFGSANLGGDDLTNVGPSDIFVASYDSDLVHRYSHGFGSSGIDGSASAALFGETLVVSGTAGGPIDYGSAELAYGGGYDALVAWFSTSDGQHVGSFAAGDLADQHASGAAIGPGGTIWTTGSVTGFLDWNGRVVQPAELKISDVFVARVADAVIERYGDDNYQPSGGSTSDGYGRIAVAPDGGVVVAGSFRGSIDFGGGALSGDTEKKPNEIEEDWYIAKLRARGR